jgi:hypothetical protein
MWKVLLFGAVFCGKFVKVMLILTTKFTAEMKTMEFIVMTVKVHATEVQEEKIVMIFQ